MNELIQNASNVFSQITPLRHFMEPTFIMKLVFVQVSQLQEALKSVSSIVLQSSNGSVQGSLPVTPRSTQSMSSLNTTGNTNKGRFLQCTVIQVCRVRLTLNC